MIGIKAKLSKSWLDPRSQRSLSAALSKRLWDRCKGEEGLFITLTYRREEYQDARDLYRCQSEEQHVPLFLRKIGRYLGESLTGRWFCKLEFQQGGWVHWHIILLGVKFIDHSDVERLWGRGFVWLHRLNRRRVQYCCKYVSKGGSVPAWLYGDPPRSVKVIRVSPGFWRDGRPKCDGQVEREPVKRWPFWRPIGAQLERNRRRVVCRDDRGRFATVTADLALLAVRLMERGCGVVGGDEGWLWFDASWEDVDAALGETATAGPGASGASRRPGSASIHSTEVCNPDAERLPWWIEAVIRENAVAMEGGAA